MATPASTDSIANSAWRLRKSRQIVATARVAVKPLVGHSAVVCIEIAIDLDSIPFLGVTDVVDSDIVGLAPKEWYYDEPLALAEDILRRYLPLTLRNHPMFNANPVR